MGGLSLSNKAEWEQIVDRPVSIVDWKMSLQSMEESDVANDLWLFDQSLSHITVVRLM